MADQGHWTGVTVDPSKHFGFVYRLLDTATGEFYMGKKNIWLKKRGVKGCKTAVAAPSAPKWKPCCWKESDWRNYNGSSKYWDKHCKESPGNEILHQVLACCQTKGILHFAELVAIVLSGSMTNPLGYNRAVPNIKFRPNPQLWTEMESDRRLKWFF